MRAIVQATLPITPDLTKIATIADSLEMMILTEEMWTEITKMTPTRAIQLAIEGGWNDEECQAPLGTHNRASKFNYDKAFLDPLFWQSLGKSLGWEVYCQECHKKHEDKYEWKKQWHSFIDNLADNKSIEDYFKSLEEKIN